MPTPLADSIREAVSLARSGNPSKGLEVLRSAGAGGVPDSDPDAALYHFTLGGLLLENGSPGGALGHLEKSQALGGRGPELGRLLGVARTQTRSLVGAEGFEQASLPVEVLASSGFFFPLLGIASLVALGSSWRLWRSQGRRTGPHVAGLVGSLAAWAAALALAAAQLWTEQHPPARVLTPSGLRTGPGEEFILLTELAAGLGVRILPHQAPRGGAGWTHVRVSPTVSGWISSEAVLPLGSGWTKRESGR